MSPLIFALALVSVLILALVGIAYIGVGLVRAWNPGVSGRAVDVLSAIFIGVGLLGLAAFLVAVYGWIPA